MDRRLMEAEAIVFDIGQVLLSFDGHRVSCLLPERHRSRLHDAMFSGADRLWPQFDLGVESNETISRRIAKKAGCPEEWSYVEGLLNRFPETLYRLLPDFKSMGKRLYCLTNFPEPSLTLTCERFAFFREMDGIVVSAREKLVKPDPAIFRLLIRRFSLCPSKTLYIDDLEENIASAANEGFCVWHYAGDDRIF